MKRFNYFIFCALFSASTIVATSCSDDDDEENVETAPVENAASENVSAINGQFSVSETKKVTFGSGNVQYNASTKTWRFAEHQYDIVGADNAKIGDADYTGYIDLFGWGTGENPTLSIADDNKYNEFCDWGKNFDDGKTWYTLTKEEWEYLKNTREDADKKYAVAEVAGVAGLIVLSDGFQLPDGLTFNAGVAEGESHDKALFKTINNYTAEDWAKIEAAGALFLPVAGYRNDTEIVDADSWGNYWAVQDWASHIGDYLGFTSDAFYLNAEHLSFGLSVRLARVAE